MKALPLALSVLLLTTALSFPSCGHAHEVSAHIPDSEGSASNACAPLFEALPPVELLREALAQRYAAQRREHEGAVLRARRAARAPEYVRVQAGGRYDRDSETRARLVQDFNGLGEPTKSGMEDRNTHQDDLYIDLRVAAEWRLSRTRWSDADVALRRESAQLENTHRDALSQLYTLWLSLGRTLQTICAPQTPPAPAASTRGRTARTAPPSTAADAWLELEVLIHQLDDLSDGELTKNGVSVAALRRAAESEHLATPLETGDARMPD